MGHRPRVPAPPGFYGCPKCGQVKPLSEFPRYVKGARLHGSHCKICKRAGVRAMRANFTWTANDQDRARFKTKYAIDPSGCHLWQAKSRDRDGYGFFSLNGRQLAAHRIAWFLAGKGVPPDYPVVLDHICRAPGCVNVAHLRIVDQQDNCTTLAKGGPFKRNLEAKACLNGHPFTPENTALTLDSRRKLTRICLACSPGRWRYGVTAPLILPHTARGKWGGWQGPPTTDFHVLHGIVTLNRD